METIRCHDCGKPVSFSARACPNCGSTEPSGSYRRSRREQRRFRGEDLNDRTLLFSSLVLGSLGASYGFTTSGGVFSAIAFVCLYGLLGLIAGVPLGFCINFWRRLM